MSYAIEPHRSWEPLTEAVRVAATAREQALLTLVRDHMAAEVQGDLQPLMQTLVADPVYNIWNQAGPMRLQGRATIEGLYRDMFEVGAEQFEFVIEKIITGSNDVVTEGHLKQIHTAGGLRDAGIEHVGESAVDESALWLSDAQIVVIWPATAEGHLIGEDTYYGEDPFATLVPVSEDDLPSYFRIPNEPG